MKKRNAIGWLFAFTGLIASGITFNGFSHKNIDLTAESLPESKLYVAPAGINPANTYQNSPTNEPWYSSNHYFTNPNDPTQPHSYSFNQKDTTYERMNVPTTWNSYRGEGVKVAVIDTGCMSTHEDFSGTDFTLSKNVYSGNTSATSWTDSSGHGTASAATIAAAINCAGGSGIAPNVQLIVLKCVDSSNNFNITAINNALQYCIDNKVDIINMSIQGYNVSSNFAVSYFEDWGEFQYNTTSVGIITPSTFSAKLQKCYENNITVVASAGNFNTNKESYPAANDHVIAVASTGMKSENRYNKAGFSNYGSWVDISAPGYVTAPYITTSIPYTVQYGTSFSAPLVTGAIALYKSKYPYAKPDQIEKALKETAYSINWEGGAGAINVGAFLDYVPVEEITVTEDNITVQQGQTYTLEPTVLPQGSDQSVTYESSDTSVCTVNSNGIITPVSDGEALVEIKSADYSEVSKLVYVEVVAGDTSIYKTFNINSSTMQSGVSSYTSSFVNVDDGISATISNGNNNNKGWEYVKFGPKNTQSTGSITNSTPIDKKITQIDLTFSQCSSVTSAKLIMSTTSTFTNPTEISFTPASGKTTTIDIPNPIANAYYKFEININNTTTTNGVVWLTKIEYYANGGSGGGETNYTVTFNANGGSGSMANQTTSGSSYTTPSCGFTKTGYTFSHWALNGTTGDIYSATDTITGISANIALYAIWSENHTSGDSSTYYSSITASMDGDTLLSKLGEIIQQNASQSYDWSRYEDADEDPNNSSNVIMIYARTSVAKTAHVSSGNIGWNREHTFPQSKLGISSSSKADNHIVYASDAKVNGTRGNKIMGVLTSGDSVEDSYGHSTTCLTNTSKFDPNNEARGIVARSTMYAAAMYGYDPEDNFESFATMLSWHLNYPVTSFDQGRNEKVYTNQHNRNPFVDHPEYACKIWGTKNSDTRQICGLNGSLSLSENSKSLSVNESFTLTATASGGSGSVSWASSDTNVCTLSTNSGNTVSITGVGAGTATITATYGSLTAQCSVTVTGSSATPSVESVSVSPKTLTLNITNGQASGTITPTVSVTGGASTSVNWSLSPSGQGVTVSGGTVTAAANATTGTYTVTATSTVDLTKSDTCTVTVTKSLGNTSDVDLPNGTFANSKITWRTKDNHCTVEQSQGSGSNAVSNSYISAPRVYKGHILKFTADSGYKISSISITYDNDNKGKYMTAGTVLSGSTVTDDTANVARTWDTVNNGTHVVSSVSNEGLQTIYIQNVCASGSSNNVQLRPTQITITYVGQSGSQTPILTSITLDTTNVTTSFTVGDTFSSSGLVVTAHYSDNSNVTLNSGDYTVSEPNMSTAGTKTITVTYSGQTATYQITVNSSGTITYQLEADVSEVPFNSGTNHVASVGVKLYQCTGEVKGSVVSSGNVNVDTSSLGSKIVQYSYNNVLYSTTVKVSNHNAAPVKGLNLVGDFSSGSSSITTPWNGSGIGSNYAAGNTPYLTKFDTTGDYIQVEGTTTAKTIHVSVDLKMIGGGNPSSFTVSAFDSTNNPPIASVSLNISGSQNDTMVVEGDINNSLGSTVNYIRFTFTKGSNIGVKQMKVTAAGETDFESKQALAWATYFINETRTADACLAEQDSQKLTGLQAKWADLAYEYTEMIGDSKDEFCTSSDATIVAARTHYLYIVSKFGAENLGTEGAFVKDSEDDVLRSKQYSALSLLTKNTPIAIIAVLSLVSVSAVGLFLYTRKRKEE